MLTAVALDQSGQVEGGLMSLESNRVFQNLSPLTSSREKKIHCYPRN